jgi:hypothetical protein
MCKKNCIECGEKFIIWKCEECLSYPMECVDCHECDVSHNYAVGKHKGSYQFHDIQYHGSKNDGEW